MKRSRAESAPLLVRGLVRERDPRRPSGSRSSEDAAALATPSLPQILHLKGEGSSLEPGQVSPSFLCCVVCRVTPPGPPLHGCLNGHILCSSCREVGGDLLSCPTCGQQDISHPLPLAESLLAQDVKNTWRPCPYQSLGCSALLVSQGRSTHAASCLFRAVRCPKAMFSHSCDFKGPYCTIQEHGRSQHGLHKGVTELEPGLITSKMFDKGVEESSCDDLASAKFQPLELQHGDHIFYCYFERVASRRLWLFFVRNYRGEEVGVQWDCSISVGKATLDRQDRGRASHVYRGGVAPYGLRREEIRNRGMMLAVPDEVMKAGKAGTVLFRVWVQVERVEK